MLRSNLLQPPNNIEIINARLDVVEKFLESEEMFFETIGILKQIPDLDSISNSLGKIMMNRLFVNCIEKHQYQRLLLKKLFKVI